MARDDDFQAGQKKTAGQKCNDFMNFIWNSEKKEFIGRTGGSWAKIGLFYLIFYSCLAGFFAIMLTGFFATLSDQAPTQQGMYSLIKSNPGMGFRPMVNVESTLIRFNVRDGKSYKDHVENINKLLDSYRNQDPAKYEDCTSGEYRTPDEKTLCKFDIDTTLGSNCTAENDYGYKNGMPCVLLKVNKVYDWKPLPFGNFSEISPDDKYANDAKNLLGDRYNRNYIGLTCEGENEGDADNIRKVSIYPESGFDFKYYPYYNVKGYLPPLVFVQFDVRKGTLIQVWCKLWARNVKHHKNDKAGSSHFELLVDDN